MKDSYYEQEQQFNWRDYFSILYRGRWMILIVFILVSSFVTYRTVKMPPMYRTSTTIEIRNQDNMYSSISSPFTRTNDIDRMINNNIQLLQSRSVAKMVLKYIEESEHAEYVSVSGKNPSARGLSYDTRVNILRGKLSVSPVRDTNILTLTVTATSPFEAAFLANTYAEQYEVYSSRSNQGEVKSMTDFLKEQLDIVKGKLKNSEQRIKNFKESEGFVSLPEETNILIQNVARFETQYNELMFQYEAMNKKIDFLKKELDDKSKRLLEDITKNVTPEIAQFRREIGKLQDRILTLEVSNKPGSDKVILGLKEKIKEYEKEIAKRANIIASNQDAGLDPVQTKSNIIIKIFDAQAEQMSYKAQADAIKVFVDQYNSKINVLPEKTLELARLERNYKINESTYMMLEKKYNENSISLAGQVGSARIVDEAITPKSPFKPNRPLYITAGLVGGLALGIFLSFIVAFFDNSIKTIEDINKLRLNFLGSIPSINMAELKKKASAKSSNFTEDELLKINSNLITHFSPKSPISEAYKSIRTNIQFSRVDDPPKVILVSSSIPKEGKSTTATNLAVTVAQSGKKVVIIDGDLRRPVVHKKFGLLREIGISDYLMDDKSLESISKNSGIENLFVITCGNIPPNPSELLGSKKMDKFINELRENFDFVIFDTPPIITVTDAAVLSNRVDGVLLVVSSGKIGKEEVARSTDILESVSANLIGVVLNNLDIKKLYGSYYYYYHYYHYYYYYGSEKRSRRSRRKVVEAWY